MNFDWTRGFLIFWAKSGIACGWLYQVLERIGGVFSANRHLRTLYNGLKFDCDLRDHVQQQIFFFGAYETLDVEIFLSLLREGDTVLDAGAEVCQMTCERFGYSVSDLHAQLKPLGYRFYRVGSTLKESGWIKDFSGITQSNILAIHESSNRKLNETWDDKAIRKKYARYS